MTTKGIWLVGVAAAIACAPPGGAGGNAGAPQRSSLLTADEIAGFAPEGKTAYDAVSRLRPRWLAARGVQPMVGASDSSEYAMVFVDGHPLGHIQSLRDIQIYQVLEIHYYDPSVSNGQYGERGSSGVIEVRMKTPRR